MKLQPITAAATRPLRQRVLRPHQRPEDVGMPGDDDPQALHAGVFVNNALVAVGSVFPDAEAPDAAWRVRGMATDPAWQGQGAGRRVLDALLAHAWASGGARVWCNARTTAAGFYLRAGLVQVGDVFELPNIGPHLVMEIHRP
ncbi:MAG: GNAT family N-acetyltransferase [Myxococcales bacterium]|nr:GNAT family N-acetyltransferase [Myxococcales bacterium]MCB9526769.1 GNAT family N-acetyltransferase [Myxococcales bacterium]